MPSHTTVLLTIGMTKDQPAAYCKHLFIHTHHVCHDGVMVGRLATIIVHVATIPKTLDVNLRRRLKCNICSSRRYEETPMQGSCANLPGFNSQAGIVFGMGALPQPCSQA